MSEPTPSQPNKEKADWVVNIYQPGRKRLSHLEKR